MLLITGSALRAQSITMSYVTVGNPCNAGDPTQDYDGTSGYGSVSYSYDIGEYDVTDSQYCTFLNDVDPTGANTLALYTPDPDAVITLNSGAASGSKYSVIDGYANMPVGDVYYWDTLRFVNWMNNGEGNASTETGAYTLLGGNTDGHGTPNNAAGLLANPQHNADATVWLPDENEWYKAAYYDPQLNGGLGGYYAYATQSDTAPGNIIGSGSNEANYVVYNGSQYIYSVTQSTYAPGVNYETAVGSFTDSASYYGTFDQSGDTFNVTSTIVDSYYPVLRGGSAASGTDYLSSSSIRDGPVPSEGFGGFRVASIPEPNSLSIPEPNSFMLILAAIIGLAMMRRKPFKL